MGLNLLSEMDPETKYNPTVDGTLGFVCTRKKHHQTIIMFLLTNNPIIFLYNTVPTVYQLVLKYAVNFSFLFYESNK